MLPRAVPPPLRLRLAPPRAALALLAALLALAAVAATRPPATAQTALAQADPAENALLAAPPVAIVLRLTEPVEPGAGAPSVRLFDAAGAELPLGPATVDPADPRRVTAAVPADIGAGAFTVGWSVPSPGDGQTRAGTYGFRVGPARPAGAATGPGEQPAAWAVPLRWLSFLGLALVAGGFAVPRLLGLTPAGAPAPGSRRRLLLIAAGALVALLATLADPVLATLDPPTSGRALTLPEAIRGLPEGWWLRLAALALALALAALLLTRRPAAPTPAADWIGLALALAALAGLSLTSHVAARDAWRPLALAANLLHQWAIALWVGGLAHLLLSWRPPRPVSPLPRAGAGSGMRAVSPPPADGRGAGGEGPSPAPIRRFSRFALGLAVVGVATGLLNAGLVLPSLGAVWESAYGLVLALKLLALVPLLALVTFHWAALRRAGARLGSLFLAGGAIRAEAALALLVVLAASLLAMMAPPGSGAAGTGSLARLDLVAPLAETAGGAAGLVHLQLQPARPGENLLVVRLTDTAGQPRPLAQAAPVQVAFAPLDHSAAETVIAPTPDPAGGYGVADVDLPGAGWWRAIVVSTPPDAPQSAAVFYLALPDPTVTGAGPTVSPADTSPEAAELFDTALAQMTALHRVRFLERLADGAGALALSQKAVADGSDGRPPAWLSRSAGFEQRIVGDREWVRRPGGEWVERLAGPFPLMADWADHYLGATDFRLGPVEPAGGEPAQVITFRTPEQARQGAAHYAWWIGTESGQVRREAMVQDRHYMLYDFADFDAPFTIDPPSALATPGATSAASPVASPVGAP